MTDYYREGAERAAGVRQLFSKIARRYDCVNDIQSLGFHRLWKHRMITMLNLPSEGVVLDLACGSGDLALLFARQQSPLRILGGDYTFEMLRVAKLRSLGWSVPPGWIHLDALSLPFRNSSFDAVAMAYGLRNMADPPRALREIWRVLKPGSSLALLDFGKPAQPWIRQSYYFFLRTIQPFLGSLFFRDAKTYRYIYESLMRYPAREGVKKLLLESGFSNVECEDLCLGTMSLHIARK